LTSRILLLLLFSLPLNAQTNLIANSGFDQKDNPLAHWIVTFKEKNETKYHRNHKWVSIVTDSDKGACLQFAFPEDVAASEGVKALTQMIPVKPDSAYTFGAELKSAGPSVIVFLEGYKVDPEQKQNGHDFFAGYSRIYRATIHVKSPKGLWSREARTIKPPKRFQPTHMMIKLYAFHPKGKVLFKNVFLRRERGDDND
jgi:hypothetical protein